MVETEKFPETETPAHPEQITRNGILLKLVRAEPHKTTEKNRKTRASCERERDSSEEEHPDSWNVSLKDPVTKRQISDIIPYVRTYETTVFWEDDLFFEMTLKETGTDLVVFGGKTFPCNEEEPVPENLYADVLRSVGLDPEAAKITSVTWKKGVNSDGTRTAYVEGKTCHRMVKDVFEGEVKLPDITMVSYTLYYEEPEVGFLKRTGTSAAPPSESRSSVPEPSEKQSSVPEPSEKQSSVPEPFEKQSSEPEPSEKQSSAPEPSGSEKTELASSAVQTPTTETTASQKTEAVEKTEDSASGETRGKTDSSEETSSSEKAALTLSVEETAPDENSETGETAAADGTSETADVSKVSESAGTVEADEPASTLSEPAGTGETGGTSENAENTGSAGLPLKGIIAGVSGIAGTLGLGALGVLFLQYRKKR